jgi:hypothetical protein
VTTPSPQDTRKKILYLMHVDWNWIKQRPHFLAEHLAERFDIRVGYFRSWRRTHLVRPADPAVRTWSLWTIPWKDRNRWLGWLNRQLLRIQLYVWITLWQPDYIWLTFAEWQASLPYATDAMVIYDCMDDDAGHATGRRKEILTAAEQQLVQRSAVVFASSENLRRVLLARYPDINHRLRLVRNAFGGSILQPCERTTIEGSNLAKIAGPVKIGYIGTVGDWLDFGAMQRALERRDDIEIHLIGPKTSMVRVPAHPRLIYRAAVRHEELPEVISKLDILTMPFVLNDLTRSVDPVKLYEYVNHGKPIVSVWYEEVDRFSPFVEFYTGTEGFGQALDQVIGSGLVPKYSDRQREEFLQENSWSSRTREIMEALAR